MSVDICHVCWVSTQLVIAVSKSRLSLPSWNLYVIERGTVSPKREGGRREEGREDRGGRRRGREGRRGRECVDAINNKRDRTQVRKGWDEVFPEHIYSESTFH